MFLVVFLEKVYICFELLLIFKSVIIRKKPKFPEPALIDSFCDMTLCLVFKKYHVLVNIF
jgi:hypothetical protein